MFAVGTAVLLVLSVVAVGMASAGEADGTRDDLAFDPDVPDTGSFTTPSADGTATVDGQTYDSAQAAVDAADSGDTVTLDGRFTRRSSSGRRTSRSPGAVPRRRCCTVMAMAMCSPSKHRV